MIRMKEACLWASQHSTKPDKSISETCKASVDLNTQTRQMQMLTAINTKQIDYGKDKCRFVDSFYIACLQLSTSHIFIAVLWCQRQDLCSNSPTSKMAGLFFTMPSFFRRESLGCCGMLKSGRIGRPWTVTWLGLSPILSALCFANSVGTKHLSTLGWNQVLWQVVRSVTTVAKLTGL